MDKKDRDELVESTDWLADRWFTKYHAAELTSEFKAWWVGYYGIPCDYNIGEDDQSEYWVRCAFALQGWGAAINGG